MFTVPGSRDIEPPREGQSILAWAIEATRRLNRRIHGEMVVESFGDVLIRTPGTPAEDNDEWVQLRSDVSNSGTTGSTAPTQPGTGNPCPWNTTSNRYAVDTTKTYTIVDTTGGLWYGIGGTATGALCQWVLCRPSSFPAPSGATYQDSNGNPYPVYEIVWAPNAFDFELLGSSGTFAITPGGSSTCYPMKPDGSGPDTSHTSPTLTVYDLPEGNRRACGSAFMTNSHGARGKAIYNTGTQQWEIDSCQTISQKIKVSIGSGCVAAGTLFTPTALTVMDPGGQDVSNGGAHYPSCTNYSTYIGNCSGVASGIVCLWDESVPGYLVVDAPCPDPNCGDCPS